MRKILYKQLHVAQLSKARGVTDRNISSVLLVFAVAVCSLHTKKQARELALLRVRCQWRRDSEPLIVA